MNNTCSFFANLDTQEKAECVAKTLKELFPTQDFVIEPIHKLWDGTQYIGSKNIIGCYQVHPKYN